MMYKISKFSVKIEYFCFTLHYYAMEQSLPSILQFPSQGGPSHHIPPPLVSL